MTKHIRDFGAKEGVISTVDLNPKSLIEKAKASAGLIGRDLVKEVTCKRLINGSRGYGIWKRVIHSELLTLNSELIMLLPMTLALSKISSDC